jgi:hypothetical protein
MRGERNDSSALPFLVNRLRGALLVAVSVASFAGCVVDAADGFVALSSWHEIAELDPRVVGMDYGITAVDQRGREAMLASCSAEFLRFRDVWASARRRIEGCVPATGEPCDGASLRFEWRLPRSK